MPEEAPPVLRLRGVRKAFGDRVVLDGVDLEVRRGEALVIMGESGSGKSVLLKLMNGLLLPDDGAVELLGEDTRQIPYRRLQQLRLRVSTLFQNYALFDSMTVAQNVAFALQECRGVSAAAARPKVDELLALLDLPHAAGLYPSSLSGGMKKRVSLARALITDPEVVLFDEPTTGLDPVLIEFVDEMLLDARARFDITSVIISHDMASAFKLADRMAMLADGRITFVGDRDAVRTTDDPRVRRFVDAQDSRLDRALEAPASVTASDSVSDSASDSASEDPAVIVRGLVKRFGDREVLHGVDFTVPRNQITTLIGGSGSGKTVTVKHVLGLMRPTAGEVRVFGTDLATASDQAVREIRHRMGMLFQSGALFDSMTVADNVAFPLVERLPRRPGRARRIRERVDDILEKLHIADLGPRFPAALSSGQRKRAALARAIASDPELLIYDEPTTGLDPVMTGYVNDMIAEAQELFRVTALVISHDMASTFRISHRIAMIHLGQILAEGPPDAIRASEHPEVQRFIYAGSVAA